MLAFRVNFDHSAGTHGEARADLDVLQLIFPRCQRLIEDIATITGKRDKAATGGDRLLRLKIPSGAKDVMGNDATTEVLYDQEKGTVIDPREMLKKTASVDKNQLAKDAQAKLKEFGGTPAAKALINDYSMQKNGFAPL